jgi:hypothetical protein
MIKRIAHKTNNYKEAEEWDILQHIQMSVKERQKAAKELKKRIYGNKVQDVREVYGKK